MRLEKSEDAVPVALYIRTLEGDPDIGIHCRTHQRVYLWRMICHEECWAWKSCGRRSTRD